jgi:histidinol-phosphate aminotransferase
LSVLQGREIRALPPADKLDRTMQICDLAPAYIRALAPYVGGKPISELAREMGISEDRIIKLASNENPLGASPHALAAVARGAAELSRYPDGNCFDLKAALARRHGVDLGQVVIGSGSNDILELVALAFLAPGAKAVYSQHAFIVYPLTTQARGAFGVEVPARDYGHDLEAMLAAIDADVRVVFIANPNNPTGTLHAPDAVRAFVARVPVEVVVVLDEAYHEYLPEAARAKSVDWIADHPNLVVTRTFSKAYGLAGLRVGYGLTSPAVADLMNRVRMPFNVNAMAQIAATAAMEDEEFVERSYTHNRDGMTQLTAAFRRMGLGFIPSSGNFVSVQVGDAAAVNARLLRQGVIVRPIANYAMPAHLRVTVGLAEENERLLAALRQSLSRWRRL